MPKTRKTIVTIGDEYIESIRLSTGEVIPYPSVVPHSGLDAEAREILTKRGWERVLDLWYCYRHERSGLLDRARRKKAALDAKAKTISAEKRAEREALKEAGEKT